jgi:hypothetical protein
MRYSHFVPFALAAVLASCGSDTGGEAVQFSVAASAPAPSAAVVTNSGWSVEVAEASVLVGPVFLFDQGPVAHVSPLQWLIPSAHAHVPANGGAVIGEWIGQVRIAAAEPADGQGGGTGEAGTVRSAELQLLAPGEVFQDANDGQPTVVIGGQATREGVQVTFGFEWSPAAGETVAISNLPADFELVDGAEVQLTLDWATALQGVDFSAYEGDESAVLITPDSAAGSALLAGLRSRFSWTVAAP